MFNRWTAVHKGYALLETTLTIFISSMILVGLVTFVSHLSAASYITKAQGKRWLHQTQVSSWLRAQLLQVGVVPIAALIRNEDDVEQELDFALSNPVVFKGAFNNNWNLGSEDSFSSHSDRLVLSVFNKKGCSGYQLKSQDQALYLNDIFVQNGNLRCRSYSAEYQLALSGESMSNRSVSLFKGIESMDVLYGVETLDGRFYWATATELSSELTARQIKSIKLTLSFELEIGSLPVVIIERIAARPR